MFGWRRTRQQAAEETDAFKMGQKAADSMIDDVDRLMKPRLDVLFDGYVGVLRERILNSFSQSKAPPLVIARIELKIFIENIDKLKSSIWNEFQPKLAEWREFSKVTQTEDLFEQLVNSRIQDLQTKLLDAGIKLLGDYAIPLGDADKQFRKANPEISSQYPENE